MNALRKHLRDIARERQKRLKKKLGKKGYSDYMKRVRKGKKVA